MLGVEVLQGGDRHVQMKLLGNWPIGPACRWQRGDALERQAGLVVLANQDQPVLAPGIRSPQGRWLVAAAVPQAQKFTVELGQLPGIFAVEDGLHQVQGPVIRGQLLFSIPVVGRGETG